MDNLSELLLMLSWVSFLLLIVLAGFSFLSDTSNPSLPGPKGLPLIGHLHMLGDLPHQTLHKLSQKYGPMMKLRLGVVPAVVVSSPQVAELFLKTHDLNFASRPKIQFSEHFLYGCKAISSCEYGSYWREMRKLCIIHLLSLPRIESFQLLRKEEVSNCVRGLKGAADDGVVVNISEQVGLVIEKITYGMIFGRGYQEKFNFKGYIQEAVVLGGAFNISDYLPFMKPLDVQGLDRRTKDISKILDEFLEKIMQEHEKEATGQQEDHKDFIDVLMSLMKADSGHEEKLDKINIKAITLEMLAASMDTTANTIDWALAELLRHPEVLKRVQDELTTVVGLHRMVEESDLVSLVYLNAIVKETMRLHPVAPLLLPRKAIKDISIEGYNIRKNTRIIVNAWAIGRDQNTWSEKTEEFYPERFINANIDITGLDLKMVPFGSGRRKCPGIQLGLRTVQFVLAQLVHCFSYQLPDGILPEEVDMKEKFGMTVPRANPLLVVPTYRLLGMEILN